jgi:MoaA/NifB/PqqE/SkfB family radical SAM enzyme
MGTTKISLVSPMEFRKFFQSNRERDFNRVTGRLGAAVYELKRGALIPHLADRMKWHVAPRLHYVVDFPTHADIEAAVSCQMRCPMCRRRQMPGEMLSGIMDLGLYKKIIDECADRGVYSVKLSWRGEPLLNPHICAMVRYAKEKGIRDVAFLTNGERLTDEIATGLIDAGLDWISISVDGTGATYERIRSPSTYRGIVEKITALKEIRDRKGMAKPLIRVQTIYGAIRDNPSEYLAFWEKVADKVYIIADQWRATAARFPQDRNYACLEPWRRIVIGWNGLVPQCICDYDDAHSLGDVNSESIHAIWHGKRFNELRESIMRGDLFMNHVCCDCHDTGIMYEKKIHIGDREIIIGLYEGQEIDLSSLGEKQEFPV